MGITVDSTFVIDALHGDKAAVAKVRELDSRPDVKILSTPVLFEVAAGLAYTGSRSELAAFQAIASRFVIASFDEPSARNAAEIKAELMRLGQVKAPVDIMIAGLAAAGAHTLVTRDKGLLQIAAVIGFQAEGY